MKLKEIKLKLQRKDHLAIVNIKLILYIYIYMKQTQKINFLHLINIQTNNIIKLK